MNRAEAINIIAKYTLRNPPEKSTELEELYRALSVALPDQSAREAAEQTATLLARANRLQLEFTKILGV